MALIIFNKKQEIGFQRFALSVFAGATLLLCLGVVHSMVHGMAYYVKIGSGADGRLLLVSAGICIILMVMYFAQKPVVAVSDKHAPKAPSLSQLLPAGYERAGDIRRLFAYVIAGDILLFGVGLHRFVLLQASGHVDVVASLGALALVIVGVFLPLHYAAMLRLDMCIEGVPEELCEFAQERFSQILYWVLVVFWACLFAAYVVLLLYSQVYCHYSMC